MSSKRLYQQYLQGTSLMQNWRNYTWVSFI